MASVLEVEALEDRHSALLRTVASDEEALAAFVTMFPHMVRDLQVPRAARSRRSQAGFSFEPAVRPHLIQLTANMAAAIGARAIRDAIAHRDRVMGQAILDEQTAQHAWFRASGLGTELIDLLALVRVWIAFDAAMMDRPSAIPPLYERFADEVERLHPELSGASDGWIAILETEGMAGLDTRLRKTWEKFNDERASRVPRGDMEEEARPYLRTFMSGRLWPVFRASLMARAILARAQAEENARRAWNKLLTWHAQRQEARALARLCGTWRWTVHNHQNHRDQTMTLSFVLPEDYRPGQLRPATVLIHGDTVYLRWEFPSGFQEDSLLLSNRDRRLEGTFVNSRGPYGSISGKRLETCSR